MNRKWYFFLHFPVLLFPPVIAAFLVWLLYDPSNPMPEEAGWLFMVIWLSLTIGGLFFITAMRLGNAFGLGFGLSFLYFLSMFFVPVPGWRVIPWIAGFFIPPDEV